MTHHEHKRDIFDKIHEGMDVYDSEGDKIGTVERLYFGSEGVDEPGPEPATAPEMRDDTLIDEIAEAFNTEDIPEEVRERLLRHGFVHVDGGLIFDKDYYVLPDKIDRVDADGVHVREREEDLFAL